MDGTFRTVSRKGLGKWPPTSLCQAVRKFFQNVSADESVILLSLLIRPLLPFPWKRRKSFTVFAWKGLGVHPGNCVV